MKKPNIQTDVTQFLDQQQVNYDLLLQSKPTTTIEETAKERGIRSSQMVKCILLRDMDNNYTLACSPGHRSVDPKKVRALLQCRRMTCVDIQDVEKITGFAIGTVGPLQLKSPIPILFDHSIQQQEIVTISSGDRLAGIALSLNDLVKLSKASFADICKE